MRGRGACYHLRSSYHSREVALGTRHLANAVREGDDALAHKLLERTELMDNQLRERIMELLQQSPGCYLGKMGRDLQVPTSTLKYHLNILRSFDLVTTVKKGRCRHYFPKRRRFTDHEKRMFAALEHAPTRRMV